MVVLIFVRSLIIIYYYRQRRSAGLSWSGLSWSELV